MINRHLTSAPTSYRLRIRAVAGSRIVRDVAANYGGTLVSALVPILALPFLLQILGEANWGIVSFVTMLVATLVIFNAGVSQSFAREFGARWAGGEEGRHRMAQLLHAYQRVYIVAAVVISGALLPFVHVIATRWLNLGNVPQEVARDAILCAIALFVAQLPASLYVSTLMAVQAQPLMNVIRSCAAVVRGLGGVMVANVTQEVLAYLVFLAIVALIETYALRHFAWEKLAAYRTRLSWDGAELRKSLRYSGKLSAIVALGVLTAQVDKFYLSYMLPIEDLGTYAIATSIAMGLLQLSYPLFTATLPHFVEIGSDLSARRSLTMKILKFVLLANFFGGGIYWLGSLQILTLWLGDPQVASRVKGALDVLVVACTLNMLYNLGYVNWISLGETRKIVAINIIGFVSAAALTPISIKAFGLAGAAISMLSMNCVGATVAMFWLANHTQFKPKVQQS